MGGLLLSPRSVTLELMDVVQMVRDGLAVFEYAPLQITDDKGNVLIEQVFRDGMKFDDVPSMRWDRVPLGWDKRRLDGVRIGMTAVEMQKIAYLLNCMLLTPKEIDELWTESGKTGTQFDMAGLVNGTITAIANIHDNHLHLEKAIAKAGGDKGGHICTVGKYWVLCNELLTGKFAVRRDSKGNLFPNTQAHNYGWPSKDAPSHRPTVTGHYKVWQPLAGEHPDTHQDPSQLCKLKYIWGLLTPIGEETREVDLRVLSQDPKWCHLVSHQGPLKTVFLPSTPPPANDESSPYANPELVA